MKCLIFVLVIIGSAFALEDLTVFKDLIEEASRVGKECAKQVGAHPADWDALLRHKVPETYEGKCMIFCMHKYFKIQKEDGSIDKEGALTMLDTVKAKDPALYEKFMVVFIDCDGQIKEESDGCQTAANIATCALAGFKKVGLGDLVFE